MANKSVISITLIIIICISFVVAIPILTISSGLSKYGTMEEYLQSEYAPGNLSSIEALNINSEIGDIEIKYIDPPVDYFVKIEVYIEMAGLNVAGKDYSDYFNIDGLDDNSPASFTMGFNSEIDKSEVLPLIKNINIVVTLRKDVIFDINITAEDGNVDLIVPFGVSVNNIVVNVTDGDVLYEFNQCKIIGNITGIINGVENYFWKIQSFNVQYTSNSSWSLIIEKGDLLLNITQHKELGANVTGKVELDNGDLFFSYNDNSANVGARIAIPWENGNNDVLPRCVRSIYIPCHFYGFHNNTPNLGLDEGILILTSFDLLEKRVSYSYNLTFELIQGTSELELISVN